MKVIVFSCNTGGGHNSAAKAVCEELERRGHTALFADMFSLSDGTLSQKVSSAYLFSTRYPWLFNGIYNVGRAVSTPNRRHSPVYGANRLYRSHVAELIEREKPDAVVTSHLFPAEALTALLRDGERLPLTVGIATDYTCIPFWEETELDRYVLPHADLEQEFCDAGLPREKLLSFGIPVSKRFESGEGRGEPDDFSKNGRAKCLVLSGSMGFGKVEATVAELLRRGFAVTAVCGNNEKLRAGLAEEFSGEERLRALGYTGRIDELMRACDIVFSKPGGLSSTEVAAVGRPLVHTSPIPGCETRNSIFFAERGMSKTAITPSDQAAAAEQFLSDPGLCDAMRTQQRKNIPHGAAARLCDFIEREAAR